MSRKRNRKQRSAIKRLFVYGIFLDESYREGYFMRNPEYATVLDYCTYGDSIVEAVHAPGRGLALTGLVVEMPSFTYDEKGKNIDLWGKLDQLEQAYNRETVTTSDGEEVYMYTAKEPVGSAT